MESLGPAAGAVALFLFTRSGRLSAVPCRTGQARRSGDAASSASRTNGDGALTVARPTSEHRCAPTRWGSTCDAGEPGIATGIAWWVALDATNWHSRIGRATSRPDACVL